MEASAGEARVLRYLPTNLSNREIADELVVSVATVKTHIHHLYSKLDVRKQGRDVFIPEKGTLYEATSFISVLSIPLLVQLIRRRFVLSLGALLLIVGSPIGIVEHTAAPRSAGQDPPVS